MIDCPFCGYAGPSPILFDFAGEVIGFEPLYPVVKGHLLIVPRRHVEHFGEDPALSARVMECAAKIARGFDVHGDEYGRVVTGPRVAGQRVLPVGESYNVITSVGAAATQTVKHLHVHLVPRREGDGLKLPWS